MRDRDGNEPMGALRPARLAVLGCTVSVLCAIAGAQAQLQHTTAAEQIAITSDTRVALGSVTVEDAGGSGVAVSAHVYVEGQGLNHEIYEFGICRDSADGPRVGNTFWRPRGAPNASSPTGATVFVTGFEGAVNGAATYVLCARKLTADAPDVVAALRGMNAVTAPAGGRVVGVQDTSNIEGSTAITSTEPVAIASVTVGATAAGPIDVAVAAHLSVEGRNFVPFIYELGICRGAADGSLAGLSFWRQAAGPDGSSFSATASGVTAFDAAVTGPATYVLCARKRDAAAPDIAVHVHGLNAVEAPAGTTLSGIQDTSNTTNNAAITSIDPVSVGALSVPDPGGADVALTAHVYLEGRNLDHFTYDVGICRDAADGVLVGRTQWRPPAAAEATAFQGEAIGVTGFDGAVTGPASYVLCIRKALGNAPDIDAFFHGLTALRLAAPTATPTATPSEIPTATLTPTEAATATPTGDVSPPATATATEAGATATHSPPEPTASATPTAVATATGSPACIGDCDGGGVVTIDELVTLVNIALGQRPVGDCEAGDRNTDQDITVDELVSAVARALAGCA